MKVGDKVYIVYIRYADARGRQPHWDEVTRVGKKFAHFKTCKYRVDLSTMYLDGGEFLSPGKVYNSEDEYAEKLKADASWSAIQRAIGSYGRPKWATPDVVAEILETIEKHRNS